MVVVAAMAEVEAAAVVAKRAIDKIVHAIHVQLKRFAEQIAATPDRQDRARETRAKEKEQADKEAQTERINSFMQQLVLGLVGIPNPAWGGLFEDIADVFGVAVGPPVDTGSFTRRS